MVHTRDSRSISSHVANLTSPERHAVSAKNSKASLVPVQAPDAWTAAITSATISAGDGRVVRGAVLSRQGGGQRVARWVVDSVALGYGPLHHRADALALLSGDLRQGEPDGLQHAEHVAGGDPVHLLVRQGRGVTGELGAPRFRGATAVLPAGLSAWRSPAPQPRRKRGCPRRAGDRPPCAPCGGCPKPPHGPRRGVPATWALAPCGWACR